MELCGNAAEVCRGSEGGKRGSEALLMWPAGGHPSPRRRLGVWAVLALILPLLSGCIAIGEELSKLEVGRLLTSAIPPNSSILVEPYRWGGREQSEGLLFRYAERRHWLIARSPTDRGILLEMARRLVAVDPRGRVCSVDADGPVR